MIEEDILKKYLWDDLEVVMTMTMKMGFVDKKMETQAKIAIVFLNNNRYNVKEQAIYR